MKHKLDYARIRILEEAEHYKDTAHSVYALLRCTLGGPAEAENRNQAKRWIKDIILASLELQKRIKDVPPMGKTEPRAEETLDGLDARADAEYAAWITAYHADHTGRVDFTGAFRILTDILTLISLTAGREEYGESERHRILSAAVSALEMTENVLDLLEYREARENDTVNGKRPDAGSDPFKKEGAQA